MESLRGWERVIDGLSEAEEGSSAEKDASSAQQNNQRVIEGRRDIRGDAVQLEEGGIWLVNRGVLALLS